MQLLFSLLFFLGFCFSPGAVGEDFQQPEKLESKTTPQPLEFKEDKIASFKENPDFDYREQIEKENWWTTFKRYLRLQWQRLLDWLFGDFDAPLALTYFLKALPYILLGLFLYFIVYLFLKLYPAGPQYDYGKSPDLILDEDEKIVKHKDIPNLIKKAILNENYRLAVRYHFLFVLQQLTEKRIIAYDASKTDEDYFSEINDKELQKQFSRVNRVYDFVWYGNFQTDLNSYNRIEREFEKIRSILSP